MQKPLANGRLYGLALSGPAAAALLHACLALLRTETKNIETKLRQPAQSIQLLRHLVRCPTTKKEQKIKRKVLKMPVPQESSVITLDDFLQSDDSTNEQGICKSVSSPLIPFLGPHGFLKIEVKWIIFRFKAY